MEMKNKLLFILLVLCLFILSAEVYLVFKNGLKEIEELIFSSLFIIFLIITSIYIVHNIYWDNQTRKNWYGKNNDLIDF